LRYSPDVTALRRLVPSAVVVFVSLVASCCVAAPVVPRELLANPGFESVDAKGMPENWSTRNWEREEKFTTARLVGKARFGQRSLQLEATTFPVFFGIFSHPVDLGDAPPRELLLTIFYRTSGSPQADLSVTTFADNFAAKEWSTPTLTSETISLEDSVAWRSTSWRLHVLPGARQAIAMVRIHGAGSVFLDGASLQPYPTGVAC